MQARQRLQSLSIPRNGLPSVSMVRIRKLRNTELILRRKTRKWRAEAPSIIKEVKGEDDPYWTEAPELGCTAAVETEVETAKASEDIAAAVEAATGSRNPTVKDFLMSYRKEDLLSIAGELGLHCKGMDQEEIAAKVAAEGT